MNFRYWRRFFALKLLLGIVISTGLLMYCIEHRESVFGAVALAIGALALIITNAYVIKFVLLDARRKQRNPDIGSERGKIVPYERFKKARENRGAM
jgi:hypothetical protein